MLLIKRIEAPTLMINLPCAKHPSYINSLKHHKNLRQQIAPMPQMMKSKLRESDNLPKVTQLGSDRGKI